MEVILRAAAKAAGLKRYYTGVPCLIGHLTERYASTGKCCECRKNIKARYVKKIRIGRVKAKVSRKKIKSIPAPRKARVQKGEIERKLARDQGNIFYSTGFPCIHGHMCPRYVYDTRCVECNSAKKKMWKAQNRHKVVASHNERRASKICATPPWLTKEHRARIEAIYLQAQIYTEVTGVPFHVDHIVPLKGKNVCGLHVPWNLRSIKGEENIRKSNKIEEDAWA
jgi:hypothetical protein